MAKMTHNLERMILKFWSSQVLTPLLFTTGSDGLLLKETGNTYSCDIYKLYGTSMLPVYRNFFEL